MSFGALTGGGGADLGASSGSDAGDVSAGLDFSLATNNAFTFGGSGKVDSRSDASGAAGNPNANSNVAALPPSQQAKSNLPLLISLGVVGLVATAAILKK